CAVDAMHMPLDQCREGSLISVYRDLLQQFPVGGHQRINVRRRESCDRKFGRSCSRTGSTLSGRAGGHRPPAASPGMMRRNNNIATGVVNGDTGAANSPKGASMTAILPDLYYRHSGRAPISSIIFSLGSGLIGGAVLAAIYAYLIYYIPLGGYISFLLTFGC